MVKKTTAGQHYTDENPSQGRARDSDRPQEDVINRMADHLKSRLSERVVLSGVKLRKTATALRNTGNCFIDEDQGMIGDYVTTAADRIEQFSSYLQDTALDELKEDARRLALNKPWLFMGACFSTGVLLARMLKASQPRS
ncbi:MAG: hypothetical protein WAL90_16765 [Desulfobacterales bacterium]